MNCCAVPNANDGLTDVTANETSTGGPTVRVAEALNEPEVAVMFAMPALVPVAKPPPGIDATVIGEELQVTAFVKFCVLPLV